MIKKIVKIKINDGLHMREINKIIRISKNCFSKVLLNCENCENNMADGCSILSILLLEASYGKNIQITVEGKDERLVSHKIEEVLSGSAGL